jgi:hypothetical protein
MLASRCAGPRRYVACLAKRTDCRVDSHHAILRRQVRDTRAGDGKREPINNLGLVANLAEQTVSFSNYVLHIDSVSAANISFSGKTTTQFGGHSGIKIAVVGDIDRVTGAMTATTESPIWTDTYDVLCKPVRPSF